MSAPNNFSSLEDVDRAREVARRYRCEFVDLHPFKLKQEFFKSVPLALMFRYNFLPLEETQDGRLAIALADPSPLMLIDEISLLLGRRLIVRVAARSQISDALKGIDPNAQETTSTSADEPGEPNPEAPVRAPKKPGPHLRSGSAKAIPEPDEAQ